MELELDRMAEIAQGIRRRVLEHSVKNNGGYMSQACSAAELLAACYGGAVKLAPLDGPYEPPSFTHVPTPGGQALSGAVVHGPTSSVADRLIISPAHYALVVYAALIETGRLSEHALEQFNADGSTVEMIGAEHSPGFETTTGSLSQAISQAGGIALARQLRGETGRTWVFMSDGEFQEGQTWEAVQALVHHQISGVRVLADVNQAQCDGPMEDVMTIEPLADRLRAFGASVDVVDGHNLADITKAMASDSDRPHFVLAYTDPVRGLPLLEERRPVLHYLRFTSEDERARYADAYEQMTGRSL